jgi:phosphoserine phosphatase RsbU/P
LLSFTNHEIALRTGDVVYIFTDGYTDQFGGPDGKKYKVSRLLDLLRGMGGLSMEKQRAGVVQEYERWRGGREQVDDILVIGFRV